MKKSILIMTLVLTVACTVSPEMSKAMMAIMENGKASKGLIILATTGNPKQLHKEIGGKIMSSAKVAERAASLLDLEKKEHLAPKALMAPNGDIYAMVAPTITKDHFIYIHKGNVTRMDVGNSEGTNKPTVVTDIVEDGGTNIFGEFWLWLTN